jgi:hypothetical protein
LNDNSTNKPVPSYPTLSAFPIQAQSPAWHKDVLASRLAKVKAGKGRFLTLSQLKQRLARRAK